jgi:hypothetical protein
VTAYEDSVRLSVFPGASLATVVSTTLGESAAAALIRQDTQARSNDCVAANCNLAIDLLGSPRTLIGGAAHSFQLDYGGTTYLGTGIVKK